MRSATVFFDGGGGPGHRPFACAAVIYLDDNRALSYSRSRVLGRDLTNNVAEWEGLILALELAGELGVTNLRVRGDSKLIVEQALGNWKIKKEHLRPLRDRAMILAGAFDRVEIDHVHREGNRRADELCRVALGRSSARR